MQNNQDVANEDGSENTDNQIKVEGYLFKRTSNAFKSWVRRWFMIQNNQLVYRKRSKDNLTIMEEDLRLCTVKPAYEIDRRFCFEVVSPARSHMLQADTEQECQLWITAIQAGVSQAYRDSPHKDEVQSRRESHMPSGGANGNSNEGDNARRSEIDSGMQAKINRMEQLLSVPGNDFCCDCGSPDPRWASINLGITLCIECSGIHRGFGVHMSKVRSVTLDAWEPELIKVMLELGNTVINRIYEANIDESAVKHATPQCNRQEREVWIRAKYIQKAFVRRLPFGEEAASAGNSEKQKRWSVQKRRRKSPSKQAAAGAASGSATPSPGSEEVKLVQGTSQDSGLGGSTNDVIVFGASVNAQNGSASLDLEDSEGSSSETEADADTQSTTSFEELSKLHPDLLLYKAAQARNLPVILEALAQGANPNWSNPDDDGKTPLIKATESGSMAPCELLLLNGAKVDRKDQKGRSALHHATVLGHTGQVCQFLKRNANQHAVDEDGNDPLSVAVKNANADIVTLLRLAKLNEEMKETEGFLGGPDETFTEVFRDFTNMANNTPERLSANSK